MPIRDKSTILNECESLRKSIEHAEQFNYYHEEIEDMKYQLEVLHGELNRVTKSENVVTNS